MATTPDLRKFMQGAQRVPVPSPAQKAEIDHVQQMQVRTNALNFAQASYNEGNPSTDEVLSRARLFADFITEG